MGELPALTTGDSMPNIVGVRWTHGGVDRDIGGSRHDDPRRTRNPMTQTAQNAVGHEQHRQTNWLRDVILGGQDGLVNILGICLGVSAATSDVQILIVAALAATFAESISMGAVAYTSSLAQRDHYQS